MHQIQCIHIYLNGNRRSSLGQVRQKTQSSSKVFLQKRSIPRRLPVRSVRSVLSMARYFRAEIAVTVVNIQTDNQGHIHFISWSHSVQTLRDRSSNCDDDGALIVTPMESHGWDLDFSMEWMIDRNLNMYQIVVHSSHSYHIPTTFTLSTPSHCSWRKEWKERSAAEIPLHDNCRIVDCSHGICCHYVDHWSVSSCAQDNLLRLWPIKFAFVSTLYSGSCHNYTMPKLFNPLRVTFLEGFAQKCYYSF